MLLSSRAWKKLTFMSGFQRAFWCSRSWHIRSFGSLTRYRETKFIIGFDFAVTLSSPESFCVLFDITSEQLVELKRLMLNKHKRWFHSSREKFPLVNMSASWFFGVDVFDLDFGVQIDSIKQPIKGNSVGPGNMSHCRTSSLHDHLDYCFVVFWDIQHNFLTRRIYVWGNKINIVQVIDHSMRLLAFVNCVRWWTNFTFVHNGSLRSIMVLSLVPKNCENQIP